MSGEMIAILAVGVALVGVILTSLRGTETRLRQDMAKLESRLEAQFNAVRGELAELRAEVAQLRERMAHLEGLLEGLREAITGRTPAR